MKKQLDLSAFSLIELMVVMLLISVLLALLAPVSQRVLENSRTTRCIANLRQTGTLVLGTIAENNGALAWYDSTYGRLGMWWYKVHLGSGFQDFSRKMTCPSLKKAYRYSYAPGNQELTGSYRYNKHMGYYNRNAGLWSYPLVRLQSISKPSHLAMLADSRYVLADAADDSTGFEEWRPLTDAHGNKSQAVVFCLDGHVELVAPNNPNRIALSPSQIVP